MLHKQPETREATLRSNHESNDIVLSDEFTDLDSGLTDYNFLISMVCRLCYGPCWEE